MRDNKVTTAYKYCIVHTIQFPTHNDAKPPPPMARRMRPNRSPVARRPSASPTRHQMHEICTTAGARYLAKVQYLRYLGRCDRVTEQDGKDGLSHCWKQAQATSDDLLMTSCCCCCCCHSPRLARLAKMSIHHSRTTRY